MIKINLLSEGRRPVVARKSRPSLNFGGQDPNNVLLLAGFVLGALVAGAWWYRLSSEYKDLQRQVRAAKARYEELKPIINKVNGYKRKSADLDRKVQVIKDLKAGQKGPVFVMDAVSRALPELLWLESMNISGKSLTVRGKAFNTNAVAAFIENLVDISEFEEPDPKSIQTSSRTGKVYNFQLNIRFSPPKPEPEEGVEEAAG